MSKFTKTLIASALAVAVTGPVSAEVKEHGSFIGTDLVFQVKPQGCKNSKTAKLSSSLEFFNLADYTQSGYYELDAFFLGEGVDVEGEYIERKVGKDLTMNLYRADLGDCLIIDTDLVCDGIAEGIQLALIANSCGAMTDAQSLLLTVTKGQTKLSKKGDRAKVDFKIEGNYYNTKKNKVRKVTATIKSPKMDFVPFVD
jgi:hypothetical protein